MYDFDIGLHIYLYIDNNITVTPYKYHGVLNHGNATVYWAAC